MTDRLHNESSNSPTAFSDEKSERAVLAIAVCQPDEWPQLAHCRPEWFHHWSDQCLWHAVHCCMESNHGCFKEAIVRRKLSEFAPGDEDALIKRLAVIVDEFHHHGC